MWYIHSVMYIYSIYSIVVYASDDAASREALVTLQGSLHAVAHVRVGVSSTVMPSLGGKSLNFV